MLPDKIRSRDDERQVEEHSHLLILRRAVRKDKDRRSLEGEN